MNCKQCGAELNPGATFCGACGATVEAPQPQPQPQQAPTNGPAFGGPAFGAQNSAPQQPQPNGYAPQTMSGNAGMYTAPAPKPLNVKLIGIIAGAVALVVALIVILFSCAGSSGGGGTSSPEDVAEKYLECTADIDFEGVFNCTLAGAVSTLEDQGVDKEDIKEFKEQFKGAKASLKITDTDVDDYDDYEDDVEEYIDDFDLDIDVDDITDAKKVTLTYNVKATFNGNTQEQNDNELRVTVVEYDGKWYALENISF